MDIMTKYGVSLCTGNIEKYESFNARKGKSNIQYDYRHSDGVLFSCVKTTIQECRHLRDKWLVGRPLDLSKELTMSQAVDLWDSGEMILIVEQGGLNRKSVNYQSKVAEFFHIKPEEVRIQHVVRNLLDYRKYKFYAI